MIVNSYFFLPKIKTKPNFYEQKSILKRNNLPIDLCKSLTPKKIKKFKKIFLNIRKNKKKKLKNEIAFNNSTTIKSNNKKNNTINIKNVEMFMNKKHSIINTETELKINKLMDIFSNDKKLQKNSAYDLIKGRLFNKLKNCVVLKNQNFNSTFENNDDFSCLKEQKEFFQKRKYSLLSKKKINIITNSSPKLFNNERITRRFEDLYMTPEEFLDKNFTEEEIEIMIKNANYFKLNKEPLKGWDLNINLTLKDSLNKEDEFLRLKNKLKKSSIKSNNNGKIFDFTINNDNKNICILSQKILKKEKYGNIPNLNLKDIDNINSNMNTEETVKKSKKKFRFSIINTNNKLLYMIPKICSKHKKHIQMYNLTERNKTPKYFYKKTIYKIRSNSKHIERFEAKQNQKNELTETKNILNEIKSNYMKKNHEKVTQDNIIKNKIKFNNTLKTNKLKLRRLSSSNNYVRIGGTDQILLAERLWK